MRNLVTIVAAAGLALTLAACTTQNPNTTSYPTNRTNNGTVYRANDGQIYRQGEVYRDRNGNVYQNGRVVRSGDILNRPGILTGRDRDIYYPNDSRRNLPPGQAKKKYGGKATDYAKGQQKKRDHDVKYWEKDHDDKYNKDKEHKKYKKGKKSPKKYQDRHDD